jgi:outer membrane protein assembly factor BamE (lipoprotein component of BamABCDE complex)
MKMHINSIRNIFWGFLLITLVTGCQSAAVHKQQVQDDSSDRMTVGKVQKEIRIGMSGAEVAQVLGSPNIVSTDEERREVWIYDKIATDRLFRKQRRRQALILGWGGGVAGAASGNVSSSAGASSTSQRTLTVIIKFDKEGKVRDFAYHTSRF